MQSVAIQEHVMAEQGPGNPMLTRCDEEGVPRLVQGVNWSEKAQFYLITLLDETTIAITALCCGALVFTDHDMTLWRIDEIVERNWADLLVGRKTAQTNLLGQVGDEPNPGLH